MLQTVSAANVQITRSERALMLTYRPQHPLILWGEVLQTVPHRHP